MKSNHLVKRLWKCALIAFVIAVPLSLLIAYSPFHDVKDYFEWGLCNGILMAETCEEKVTVWRIVFAFLPDLFAIVFIFCLIINFIFKLIQKII